MKVKIHVFCYPSYGHIIGLKHALHITTYTVDKNRRINIPEVGLELIIERIIKSSSNILLAVRVNPYSGFIKSMSYGFMMDLERECLPHIEFYRHSKRKFYLLDNKWCIRVEKANGNKYSICIELENESRT